MRRSTALILCSAVWLWACGTAPERPSLPASTSPDGPRMPTIQRLPAGSLLQLEDVAVVASGSPVSPAFTGALLHEALRQSTRFDFAAGIESCDDPDYLIQARIDEVAAVLTLALEHPDGAEPALPLASASFADQPLPRAIDAAAWQARIALGETVPEEPLRSASIYSSSTICVRETESALQDENRGVHGSRRARLERAGRADPGCTITINAMTNAALGAGRQVEALRLAETAQRLLLERCSPTTAHRIERALWLARAATARSAEEVRGYDQHLLEAAEAFIEQRPHDPHGRYTRALAWSYLGEFDRALIDLRELRRRWPGIPWVAYHLAFAEIAAGDPDSALDHLEMGARRLPLDATLLPRALALYEAGYQDELREGLGRMLARRRYRADDRSPHEVRHILAAQAILRDDPAEASRLLLDDLEWLRQRPSQLEVLALDLARGGTVLIALGHGDQLAARLPSLQAVAGQNGLVLLALSYLDGLIAAHQDDQQARVELSMENLRRAGRSSAAITIQAAAAAHRGEYGSATALLQPLVANRAEPLVVAQLIDSLRSAGRVDEAEQLANALRERMMEFELRGPMQHPLLSPELALAWRTAGGEAPLASDGR